MTKSARRRRLRVSSPHDALFKAVFGDPARAAELLRHLLPRRLARRIDWSSLRAVDRSFLDDTLRGRHADLVFTARLLGRRTLVYLLLEHKSSPHHLTVFQVVIYIVRIWERWLAQHPHAKSLPAVLPLVFAHGKRRWRAPRWLADLIALPRSMRSWRGALPGFTFEFVDLNARSLRNLARRRLPVASKLPLLHLQKVLRRKGTAILLRRWADLYREVQAQPGGQSIVNRLVSYVAAVSNDDPRRLRSAYRYINRTTETKYMTVAEKLIRKGRRKGRIEGRIEGRSEVLRVQLEERFGRLPEAVLSRLATATAEELERWARAILKSKTLAATLR